MAEILNKPSLAAVATSGSYTDLSNKPTIPAAQVNSDWNASSGVAQILNKPTIPSGGWTETVHVPITGWGTSGDYYYKAINIDNSVDESKLHPVYCGTSTPGSMYPTDAEIAAYNLLHHCHLYSRTTGGQIWLYSTAVPTTDYYIIITE